MPYRTTATALGLASVTLAALGLAGDHRYLYVLSVLVAIAASAMAILVRLEAAVERIVQCEVRRSRAVFAAAVAEALADELDGRRDPPPAQEPSPRLTSVR